MTTGNKKSDAAHAAKAKERRTGSQELVQKLVVERTEMFTLYGQLAGLKSFGDEKKAAAKQVPELLQKFCQVLVDYIAAGHFSLYERIVNGTERRQQVSALAEKLYPQIANTTEAALDFNDKYDCGDHCKIAESFNDDLSRLGEQLAQRIELEDRLITQFRS